MSTRAIQFLRKKNVDFNIIKYNHEEKGAEFASKAIGFPLEKTIKTLVVDIGSNQYALVLMPGDKQLDLKRLATELSVKRAAMADVKTAERLTGYLVGGISPFGTKQRLPVAMESGLIVYEKVAINAGQRGTMLIMAPVVIRDILDAKVCDISQNEPENL